MQDNQESQSKNESVQLQIDNVHQYIDVKFITPEMKEEEKENG